LSRKSRKLVRVFRDYGFCQTSIADLLLWRLLLLGFSFFAALFVFTHASSLPRVAPVTVDKLADPIFGKSIADEMIDVVHDAMDGGKEYGFTLRTSIATFSPKL
jgi:hypothetical protein